MRLSSKRTKLSRIAAFSLVELMMVVAVLSSLAAGAIFTFSSVTKVAGSTKLQRDIRVVNDAIRTYRVNGGTFTAADLTSPAALLAKLKRKATAESAKQFAGLRDSYADSRLSFEMQTTAEADEGAERGRFIADANNPRFVIEKTGGPGIRRFVLDDSLASTDYGTETRRSTMKLAAEDKWVWDYAPSDISRETPATRPALNATLTADTPPDYSVTVLSPPSFSLASGTYPINTFPQTVSLASPNAAGSSQILYTLNGTPFTHYSGPISIEPGDVVSGICVTLDPDLYQDSTVLTNTYEATPLTPIPVVNFVKNSYTFFELGGTPAPGTPAPLPERAADGSGIFSNASDFPEAYHNSSTYRFTWTYDGSSPLTGTPLQQADFSAMFASTPIGLPGLSDFGTGTSATLQAAIRSYRPAILENSSILTRTFDISLIDLRPPLISADGRDLTLSLDLSERDMPANARIFYTTDGTDPGVSAAGDPVSGTEYTGPVALTGATGASLQIRARTYAPQTYRQFFEASDAAVLTYTLPAATAVYVGGNFVNSGGQPLRNLARLGNSGQVDPNFDTGTGASPDSMVGVVRDTGGNVLAGGDFDSMDGTAIMGIVRLNGDGSVDTGFNAGLTAR